MNPELFEDKAATLKCEWIGPQSCVLRGAALLYIDELLPALETIERLAPSRHMVTPNGFQMSASLTNYGTLGWVSDRHGYRYTTQDPQSGRDWPAMPDAFMRLAQNTSASAGFANFIPDACLINRYTPGARLSLHQDKNELDFDAPIVSVSLGIPAIFLFGGNARTDRAARIALYHGDVAVWGGVDRLRYHGILPLKDACHPLLGAQRINLTFRKAG